jgi:hypothetical protein
MATRSQGEHAKGNIQYGSGVEASWNFGAGLRGVCARFLWSVRLAAWRPLDTELAEPRRRLSVGGLSARVLSGLARSTPRATSATPQDCWSQTARKSRSHHCSQTTLGELSSTSHSQTSPTRTFLGPDRLAHARPTARPGSRAALPVDRCRGARARTGCSACTPSLLFGERGDLRCQTGPGAISNRSRGLGRRTTGPSRYIDAGLLATRMMRLLSVAWKAEYGPLPRAGDIVSLLVKTRPVRPFLLRTHLKRRACQIDC